MCGSSVRKQQGGVGGQGPCGSVRDGRFGSVQLELFKFVFISEIHHFFKVGPRANAGVGIANRAPNRDLNRNHAAHLGQLPRNRSLKVSSVPAFHLATTAQPQAHSEVALNQMNSISRFPLLFCGECATRRAGEQSHSRLSLTDTHRPVISRIFFPKMKRPMAITPVMAVRPANMLKAPSYPRASIMSKAR